MNSVVVTGRIASDVELQYLPKGTALAKFRIAVRDSFRKKEEGKPDADFFDVVAWGTSAEFTANYLAKGDGIALKGRLRQETWNTQQGEKRQRVVVVAESVEGNGPPKPKDGEAPRAVTAAPAEEPEYDLFASDDV